ncbi:type 4a pilus biogenesis protein PilO [Candidatus Roizmanbacteria bacterium]|nr:type 4a pilus biogenesis protein PilO [Candidatus Roizmanbacteria bacterium]
MERNKLIQKIFNKKTVDYSYAIIFFLVCSFFLLFVIRPNIISVASSSQKIDELSKNDNFLENQVQNIVKIQSSLETNRDNLSLLEESIAKTPQVNKILSDLNTAVKNNNLTIETMNITDINLKDISKENQPKSVNLDIFLRGSFPDFVGLVKEISSQRRLKLVKSLLITKENQEGSGSATLNFKLQVASYYL